MPATVMKSSACSRPAVRSAMPAASISAAKISRNARPRADRVELPRILSHRKIHAHSAASPPISARTGIRAQERRRVRGAGHCQPDQHLVQPRVRGRRRRAAGSAAPSRSPRAASRGSGRRSASPRAARRRPRAACTAGEPAQPVEGDERQQDDQEQREVAPRLELADVEDDGARRQQHPAQQAEPVAAVGFEQLGGVEPGRRRCGCAVAAVIAVASVKREERTPPIRTADPPCCYHMGARRRSGPSPSCFACDFRSRQSPRSRCILVLAHCPPRPRSRRPAAGAAAPGRRARDHGPAPARPLPQRPGRPLPARRPVAVPPGPRGRRACGAGFARQAVARRLDARRGPPRLERHRPLRRERARLDRLVPQGLPRPARRQPHLLAGPLRVGQLPRPRLPERPRDRPPRGRLRPVRAARVVDPPRPRQPPGRPGRLAPAQHRHPGRAQARPTAAPAAAGGTTAASCARPTCAGSTASTSSASGPPGRRLPTLPGQARAARHAAQPHGQEARRSPCAPTSRAATSGCRASSSRPRHPRGREGRHDPRPAPVAAGQPAALHRARERGHRRPRRQHLPHRGRPALDPRQQARADGAERPPRRAARREHARGLARPRRRADHRADPARRRAAARR